jgi:acetylornithine deacetylase
MERAPATQKKAEGLMRVDREYLTKTLADLVRIDSVNPALDGTGAGEGEIAARVAQEMERLGMEVTRCEPEPGRVSVLGRLPGIDRSRSLMLYAHLDTVGVGEMPEPFSGAVRDGRLHGRGAYDMKGGLAACLAAVKALSEGGREPACDLLLAAVADEEVASLGMADLLTRVVPDAAIVTEATEMRLCVAHKGFCWIEVETLGRAAHGSRFEEGVDANLRMGRFLARLEALERRLRGSPPHPLVGPPSLHAATLRGGTGPSTYAASCRLEIERRTIPGETPERVLSEIRQLADALEAEDPTFRARVRLTLGRESFEAQAGSVALRVVGAAAAAVLGETPRTIGEPYWMDAALLAERGVDTVVLGPRGAGAHAVEEWVDLASLEELAEVLARSALAYGRE